MGFRAILLCGDPDYYLRQGFIPAETLGIRTEDNMYATTLHVCELYDNALANAKGRYMKMKYIRLIDLLLMSSTNNFLQKKLRLALRHKNDLICW